MKSFLAIVATVFLVLPVGSIAQPTTSQNQNTQRRSHQDEYNDGRYVHTGEERLSQLYTIGIEGNSEKISELRKVLQNQVAGIYLAVAGRALARLNSQEAVADFEKIIAESTITLVRDWAKVMRARLLAQSPDFGNNASRRLAVFLKEIGRTPKQFAQALRDYNKLSATDKANTFSMEITALSELSDMVYRGDSEAWLKLPEIKALDVSGVRAARYRMAFAAVPKEQRAEAIVDALVKWEDAQPHVTAQDADARFLLRMALDEGKQGAKAAVEKLKTIDAQPDKFSKQNSEPANSSIIGWLLAVIEDSKAVEVMPTLATLQLPNLKSSDIQLMKSRMTSSRTSLRAHFMEGLQAR